MVNLAYSIFVDMFFLLLFFLLFFVPDNFTPFWDLYAIMDNLCDFYDLRLPGFKDLIIMQFWNGEGLFTNWANY